MPEKTGEFYHSRKPHMSPSAFQQWHHQRAAFVGSYFEEKERVETKAMTAGKQIHRLIEGGMIQAKLVYDINEEEIKVKVPNSKFWFMGIPDSRTGKTEPCKFVDYKSGRANEWENKLPTDLKMKATAWLIWQEALEIPQTIHGAIEFIQTTWDPEAKQVVPLDTETEIIEINYSAKELGQFTDVIVKTMREVNKAYEKWQEKNDAFVNQEDVQNYEALHLKKETLEREMEVIRDRIKAQMEFSGVLNFKSDNGTFYLTERKTYAYPLTLPIGGAGLTLEDAEKIAFETKQAQKNYELISEPASVSVSVGFRAKKA